VIAMGQGKRASVIPHSTPLLFGISLRAEAVVRGDDEKDRESIYKLILDKANSDGWSSRTPP